MRKFYEVIEGEGHGCFYKSLLHAFDYCEIVSFECGNSTPTYTDCEDEINAHGRADVGQFTIIVREFED